MQALKIFGIMKCINQLAPYSTKGKNLQRTLYVPTVGFLKIRLIEKKIIKVMSKAMEAVACNMCGNEKYVKLYPGRDRLYGLEGSFYIVKCLRCGLVYTNPRPTEKEIGIFYPSKNYYSYQDYESESLFRRLRRIIIEKYYSDNNFNRNESKYNSFFEIAAWLMRARVGAIPTFIPGGRILDVGCGSGETVKILKDIGWNAWGLEVDEGAVKIGRHKELNVKYGNLLDSKFRPEFFDVVRFWHVFEHLHRPRETLQEVYKILRRGGELIIGVPNLSSLQSKIFRQRWYHLDIPRHLYHFTKKTLSDMIASEGFRIKNYRFISGAGISGSIGYLLEDKFGRKWDLPSRLVNNQTIVFALLPFEICTDFFRAGEIMDLRAIKE